MEALDDDPPLASGTGEDGSCLYECSALSEYYFPEQDMARCFMFDEATGSWPAELLDLKRERLDVYTYESTNVDGGIEFTIVSAPLLIPWSLPCVVPVLAAQHPRLCHARCFQRSS